MPSRFQRLKGCVPYSDPVKHRALWGPPPSATDGRRERWEQRAELPLAALAVLFLVAFSVPILWPELDRTWVRVCRVLEEATYLCFVADYLTRFVLSRDRLGYIRHSFLDLLILALPMLRPLRTLRLVSLLQVLDRRIGRTLRGQIVVYLMVATSLVLFVAALAVLDVERDASGSNIRNFPDALWWAATTITTVGYGEHHPVTGTGRVVAGALMFSGIALLGTVTASIAAWMVERLRQVEEEEEVLTRADIHRVHEELRLAREEIAALRQELRRSTK